MAADLTRDAFLPAPTPQQRETAAAGGWVKPTHFGFDTRVKSCGYTAKTWNALQREFGPMLPNRVRSVKGYADAQTAKVLNFGRLALMRQPFVPVAGSNPIVGGAGVGADRSCAGGGGADAGAPRSNAVGGHLYPPTPTSDRPWDPFRAVVEASNHGRRHDCEQQQQQQRVQCHPPFEMDSDLVGIWEVDKESLGTSQAVIRCGPRWQ
jgi:hypothetical protein